MSCFRSTRNFTVFLFIFLVHRSHWTGIFIFNNTWIFYQKSCSVDGAFRILCSFVHGDDAFGALNSTFWIIIDVYIYTNYCFVGFMDVCTFLHLRILHLLLRENTNTDRWCVEWFCFGTFSVGGWSVCLFLVVTRSSTAVVMCWLDCSEIAWFRLFETFFVLHECFRVSCDGRHIGGSSGSSTSTGWCYRCFCFGNTQWY